MKNFFWIATLGLILSIFYVYWEMGHLVTAHWDQETFFYSYNNAFLKLFAASPTWPQWNPYMQSGVSLNSNMPFQLSLGRFLTLATGSGLWGHFLATSLILAIASICLLRLLKKMECGTVSSVLALVLYLEYQLALYSPEAVAANVAVVSVFTCLAYGEKPRFIILGLAALYLGASLNSWPPHATLAVFVLQILLAFFLRKTVPLKRHLYSIGVIWLFGLLLSAPTLLPLMADSKTSQKVLTYAQTLHSKSLFQDILFYVYTAFVLRLSTGMVWVMTLALGLPILFWSRWNNLAKAFIKASYLFFILLAAFYFFKTSLTELPVLGKIFAAFNPMRPTIVGYACISILFGLSVNVLLEKEGARQPFKNVLLFLAPLFGILFFVFGHVDAKFFSKPDLLAWLMWIPFLGLLYFQKPLLKTVSALILLTAFFALWAGTGARYYTRELPKKIDLRHPLGPVQTSLFPDEDSASNDQMLLFLQEATKNGFQQTADLRYYPVGSDMFQRYAALQISTIHGWSSFRPLKTHFLYLRLLDDVKIKSPQDYNFLSKEGGFSYSFGSRFNTDLLNVMGVRYLIAEKSDNDPRFKTVMEGEKYKILENKAAYPRAFLASEAKTARFGKVKITEFLPNSVTIKVESKNPELLVLTQSYHDGWKAYLAEGERRPLPVSPAYYDAFLSTEVPAGSHLVEFVFSDRRFQISLYIAGTALAVLLILMAIVSCRHFAVADRNRF